MGIRFRKTLLMNSTVCGWLLCLSAVAWGVATADEPEGTIVSVLDFGAVPDDGQDDGPAVRAAVAACGRLSRPCLVFAPGVYHFRAESTKATALIEFRNLPDISVRGEKATLVGNGSKTLLRFEDCGEVSVSGLDIDWDPLPFTAGRVVVARDDSIDIEVVSPHPLCDDSAVQSLTAFDPQRRVPLGSSDPGYYQLTQKAYGKKAEMVGPNRLRIPISPQPEILRAGKQQRVPAVGTHVLALYRVRGGGAIRPFGCGNVRFDNVSVFATLGMGFAMNACDRVNLHQCRVVIKPDSGRWMSSTVDATHCNMVRQRVEYTDCVFEGMGDDAINVHGMYSMVQERLDDRSLVLRGWKSIFDVPGLKDDFAAPAQKSLRTGDVLEFGTNNNPLVPVFTARIRETEPIEVKGVTLKRIRLDRDLPGFVQAGSIVADTAEIPECLIRNCTVRGGRGCGVRLKTRVALVEGCTFEHVHGAGLWITCDAEVDHESIAARDVTIHNNLFRHVSPAISASAGRKIVYPDVHENLVIAGNRIEAAPRTAIAIRSTRGAVVRDNLISSAAAQPIEVSLSSNIRLENNRVSTWTKQPASNGQPAGDHP